MHRAIVKNDIIFLVKIMNKKLPACNPSSVLHLRTRSEFIQSSALFSPPDWMSLYAKYNTYLIAELFYIIPHTPLLVTNDTFFFFFFLHIPTSPTRKTAIKQSTKQGKQSLTKISLQRTTNSTLSLLYRCAFE